MKNVLVTGATGFIGSHLVEKLVKEGNDVVVLVRDILPSPWVNWVKETLKDTTRVRGDILNLNLIKRILVEYEIDHVYHLAAQAIVRKAIKDPVNTYRINLVGTLNILEAARQVDTEKTIIMSTDKVFGERIAATHDDPVSAGGIYETSKACADLIAQSFLQTYGMKIAIARSCNAYGYDLSPRIIPNTIRKCLTHKDPIIYKGEKSYRQYIHINDLTDALIHLMKGEYVGLFNIATPDILTQEEVVLEILSHFKHLRPKYIERENPPKEIKTQSMILTDFDWKPKITFAHGIKMTIDAFRKWRF